MNISLYKYIGIAGLIAICVSMLVKRRTTRDMLAVFGGACLLIYSIYLKDIVFIILQAVYILVTVFDFVNKKFFHPNANI